MLEKGKVLRRALNRDEKTEYEEDEGQEEQESWVQRDELLYGYVGNILSWGKFKKICTNIAGPIEWFWLCFRARAKDLFIYFLFLFIFIF